MCEPAEISQEFPEPVRGVDYELIDGGYGFLVPRQLKRSGLDLLGASVAAELANVPTERGSQ